jgi:hypothetical protein
MELNSARAALCACAIELCGEQTAGLGGDSSGQVQRAATHANAT